MPHLPSHFALETVKIKDDNPRLGWRRINKSDFDGSIHEIYEEPVAAEPEAVEEEPAEAVETESDELDEMTRDGLRQLAFDQYGVQLTAQMKKSEMIAAIRDLRTAE